MNYALNSTEQISWFCEPLVRVVNYSASLVNGNSISVDKPFQGSPAIYHILIRLRWNSAQDQMIVHAQGGTFVVEVLHFLVGYLEHICFRNVTSCVHIKWQFRSVPVMQMQIKQSAPRFRKRFEIGREGLLL